MAVVASHPRHKPMQALVFDGSVRLGQLPAPEPAAGEVLVRVHACAISRADLDMVSGRRAVQVRPVILGHQFVGTVESTADEAHRNLVGRRCVAWVHPGCGGCPACRQRTPWKCDGDLTRSLGLGLIDGAFAERVVLPARSVVEVPESMDDDDAVFAHPVAAALAALEQVQGPAPQRVLVVGDGNMGLLVTLMLHAAGHTVSVFGRHPSRRDLLWRSGISFTGVHETAQGQRAALPEDDFARDAFGTVFECSGRGSGFNLALQAVRPRGRIVLVSDLMGEAGFDLRAIADRELEISGIHGGSLPEALDYLATGKLDTLPLVAARLPMAEGPRAFQQAMRRGTLKVILENPQGGAR